MQESICCDSAACRPGIDHAVDVPGGAAFDIWRLQVLTPREFEALGAAFGTTLCHEQLLYLVGFAALAPTSHNTVPQRLKLNDSTGGLTLYLDRQYVLPESDPSGRQALISCGCAVEYIALAAAAYGYRVDAECLPVPPELVQPLGDPANRYTALARLSFKKSGSTGFDTNWLGAMLTRKSVRTEYDPRVELPSNLEGDMSRIVASYARVHMDLLKDSPSLTILGKFQELADTTVFNRERFARELGDWLLPNDARDDRGMRGSEFGMNDEMALRFHRGLSGCGCLLPDEVAGMTKSSNKAMRSSSAVVVLSTDGDTLPERLEAGRAYARLTLLLHQSGFVTAMHAAIAEVDGPNLALRGRLRTRRRPVVLFRTGKILRALDGKRPHSARPAPEALLLS